MFDLNSVVAELQGCNTISIRMAAIDDTTADFTFKKFNSTTNTFDDIIGNTLMNDDVVISGPYTLPANSYFEYKYISLSDGVYQLTTVCNAVTTYTTVLIVCSIKACIKDYLDTLITCNCDCNDTDYTKNQYNFNALLLLYNEFVELGLSFSYFGKSLTDLEHTQLLELNNIVTIMNRMNDYCKVCTNCTGTDRPITISTPTLHTIYE